jgi:hypothetical protein
MGGIMNEDELIEQTAAPILQEYRLAFKALRGCIQHISDEDWIKGSDPGMILASQVCHLLWACDGYSGGWKVKASTKFGVPAGSFANHIFPQDYPGRGAVMAYVDEVEQQVSDWVVQKTRQNLTGKKKIHPPLTRVIYTLRHTVVHLSYLMRDMHLRGIPRPDY